jgi:hypothetical protein
MNGLMELLKFTLFQVTTAVTTQMMANAMCRIIAKHMPQMPPIVLVSFMR